MSEDTMSQRGFDHFKGKTIKEVRKFGEWDSYSDEESVGEVFLFVFDDNTGILLKADGGDCPHYATMDLVSFDETTKKLTSLDGNEIFEDGRWIKY